jgi:hypothetical protein
VLEGGTDGTRDGGEHARHFSRDFFGRHKRRNSVDSAPFKQGR